MPVVKASELRSKELDPLFEDPAVLSVMGNLDLDPYLTQDNMLLWIDSVKQIESSGGKNTSNKERVGTGGTSAKGNYQFTDETYRSYLQSTANQYKKINQDPPKWVERELKNPKRDPRNISDYQQQVLLVVGTYNRGKNPIIKAAWSGDINAGKKLFADTHHTNPDSITKYVMNREFDKRANQIVTVQDDMPSQFEPALESMFASMQTEAMQSQQEDPSMFRPDGSRKSSQGFLGPMENAQGQTMTEYSVGVNINGKQTDVPSMVPGLNSVEIGAIQRGNIPESVQIKAKESAQDRIAQGLSPFYQDMEQYTDYKSVMDQRLAEVTPTGVRKEPELFSVTPTGQRIENNTEQLSEYQLALRDLVQFDEDQESGKPIREDFDKNNPTEYQQALMELIEYDNQQNVKDVIGGTRTLAQGLSWATADEAEALARSLAGSGEYGQNLEEIRASIEEYRLMNPNKAFFLEAAGAYPTGFFGSKLLTKAGVTSPVVQGGGGGALYGGAAGETPEERAKLAAMTGTLGATIPAALIGAKNALTKPPKSNVPDVREITKAEKGTILNYTKADGSNVMVKVMGKRGDKLIVTTDILNPRPARNKFFEVSQDSSDISVRFDDELVGGEYTAIERVKAGEEAPYSPIYTGKDMPEGTSSGIGVQVNEAVGPGLPTVGDIKLSAPFANLSKTIVENAEKIIAKLSPELAPNINVIAASSVKRFLDEGLSNADIAQRFGVEEDIINDIVSNWDRIDVQDSTLGLRGRAYGKGRILLNDLLDISDDELSLTLDHELGHEATKSLMGKELNKHIGDWKSAQNPLELKPATPLGREIKAEFLRHWKEITKAYGSSPYSYNQMMQEWMADNVVVWVRKLDEGVKPKTKVEQWFAAQANKLKEIWGKISSVAKKERLTAAEKGEKFQQFLDDYAASNRPREGYRPTSLSVVRREKPKTDSYRPATPEQWTESVYGVDKGPSWRDAKTPGEFFDGIIAGLKRTYDRMTPMTDLLQRNVSREVGANAQVADETATKVNQLDFEKYVAPATEVFEKFDSDLEFRKLTLLYSENSITRNELINYVAQTYGGKGANNLLQYLNWSERKNRQMNRATLGIDKVDNYLHRQQKFKTKKEEFAAIDEEFVEPLLPYDVAQKLRRVNIETELKRGNTDIIDRYQNPYFTNTRRILNNEKLFQYMKRFGVKSGPGMNSPEQILFEMRRQIEKRGISRDRAEYAITEIRRNLLGERKLMNQTLQALQTLGYAGSLAGPKSALLNLHDIPQTAVNQGPMAVRSWFKGILRDKNQRMLADSFGFSQQSKFGEFANALNQSLETRGGLAKTLNESANVTADTLMKASLFQLFDKVGKGGVLRSVQQRAVDDVVQGGWQQLKNKWGTYFTDNELKIIARDLKRHGMDDSKYSAKGLELTEQLMMGGLGQQQLISSGGRPAIWADHPNARIFLALRGFAMKQQAVALRNTFQTAKEGNVEEAKQWAIRYALYSMGAFAAINEGRQILFGDGDPSARRMVRSFFDQLVGVMSLNSASISDYSWGKLQRGEFLEYVLANNVPIALGVPAEAVDDALDVLTGEKEAAQLPETLPLFKQTSNLMRNVEDFRSNQVSSN